MVRFADGIDYEKEDFTPPKDVSDKTCGECVRCEKRDWIGETGYHCTMQHYDIDISPEDKACKEWWDKANHERIERINNERQEKRREELWVIYANKPPVKLPIAFDGYGMIPECPVCGEMPYSTEQCHWCGQRFIQDDEIEEYTTPEKAEETCIYCGGKVVGERSKYNGHFHGICEKCGAMVIE